MKCSMQSLIREEKSFYEMAKKTPPQDLAIAREAYDQNEQAEL